MGVLEATRPEMLPRVVDTQYPDFELIYGIEAELRTIAANDPNGSATFLPRETPTGAGLDACKEFASRYGIHKSNEREYELSFIRFSEGVQQPLYGPHIDMASDTGLGEYDPSVEVWKYVENLGRTSHSLRYAASAIDLSSFTIHSGLMTAEGYDGPFKSKHLATRTRQKIKALEFCASHVLHQGFDTHEGGHLIAVRTCIVGAS